MRRGLALLAVGIALVVTLATATAAATLPAVGGTEASGATASRATPPGNFKRHVNRYWTWYAPPGWGAAYGANDMYITSPTGKLYLRYGQGG